MNNEALYTKRRAKKLNAYYSLMENIPISVQEIYNLLIKYREALKMDMSTDMVEIEVPISTIFRNLNIKQIHTKEEEKKGKRVR